MTEELLTSFGDNKVCIFFGNHQAEGVIDKIEGGILHLNYEPFHTQWWIRIKDISAIVMED